MGERTFEYGDWVIKYGPKSEDIIKIKKYEESDDENKFDFKPLPINPLILLDNDFEFCSGCYTDGNILLLHNDWNNGKYNVCFSSKFLGLIKEKQEKLEDVCKDGIEYIYQIQRVFNILNIDKELIITTDLNNLN